MPWKECHVVDERLRFIARRLDGEPMPSLCREFGISRKTGYKAYARYKDCGLAGLTDGSRLAWRSSASIPAGGRRRSENASGAGIRRCCAPRSVPSTPSSTAMAS